MGREPWDSLPLKVKLPHTKKTVLGMLLAVASNKALLESTTQVLMHNYSEQTNAQRIAVCCVFRLKALSSCYRPSLLSGGFFVCECNWNGGTAQSTAVAKARILMNAILVIHMIP